MYSSISDPSRARLIVVFFLIVAVGSILVPPLALFVDGPRRSLRGPVGAERAHALAGETRGGAYCSFLLAKIDTALKVRLDRQTAEQAQARIERH